MSQEQEAIGKMFDRIAPTYDPVNRILSFGQDVRWRQTMAELLPKKSLELLDIATGTADLLIALDKRVKLERGVGIDISENMLAIGQKKISDLGLDKRLVLKKADASLLPFADDTFDVVTIAFGIRNVIDRSLALKEFKRVLRKDGFLLILEFSLPENILIKNLYLFYFRHILPMVGGIISRDFAAYRYLNRSVENFPSAKIFSQLLKDSGFAEHVQKALSYGIATIYCVRKF